ncbi:MAG: alpha/beta fold hydrolase [Desulfobacteraceae bacterium]|nr:alpha/beta fold hydrolase [Desulfobacteraceae bacterium]MBC2755048.1 alpha/beta fold hydrolase [Desulfobacteraceae bacterium]
MIIIYLLVSVLLITTWVTTSLYIVVWYDAVNLRTRADEGQWRKGIRFFSILQGVFIESLCLFFIIITTPLRFYFDRIPKNPQRDSRPPILFVHGWGSGSHAFMLIYLLLKKHGFKNLYFMTYRPIFADAGELANQVAEKIDFVRQKTGSPKINVISHSMGGVLTRYAVKNAGANEKVEKLIALGGPHLGSRVSAFMPMGKNTLQMAYKSAFITELASDGMTPGDTDYISIYSDFDNFVIPQDSAHLGENAKNIKVPFHGHIRLLYSYHVIQLIIEELRRE